MLRISCGSFSGDVGCRGVVVGAARVGANRQHYRSGSRSGRRRDSKCDCDGYLRINRCEPDGDDELIGFVQLCRAAAGDLHGFGHRYRLCDLTKDHVTLNIAATLPLNFDLTVGAASTTVNVAGVTAAPIETQSYQLSNVIDAKQITNLPLVLRDPYQLVLLSSGAVTASNNDGGFAINGQRDRNNNFLLDGADNNDTSVPGIPGGLVSPIRILRKSSESLRIISTRSLAATRARSWMW